MGGVVLYLELVLMEGGLCVVQLQLLLLPLAAQALLLGLQLPHLLQDPARQARRPVICCPAHVARTGTEPPPPLHTELQQVRNVLRRVVKCTS